MSSPNPCRHDNFGHSVRSHESARGELVSEEGLLPSTSMLKIATRSSSAYSALQQHPGFHQFKIERPPPGASVRLIRTRGEVKEETRFIDEAPPPRRAQRSRRDEPVSVLHQADYVNALAAVSPNGIAFAETNAVQVPAFPAVQVADNANRFVPRTDTIKTRRPALAATHPALYTRPSLQKIDKIMPPQREYQKQPAKRQRHSLPHESQPELEPPPWQAFSDPKHLISAVPVIENPRFRMLKMDVQPDQPCVVSPLFMIALPLGTLIEGANYYEDSRT